MVNSLGALSWRTLGPLVLVVSQCGASAQAQGAAAGAFKGLVDAINDIADQEIAKRNQEALARQRHELEMERMRLQAELDAQRKAAEAAAREREEQVLRSAAPPKAGATNSPRSKQQEEALVNSAHPGWQNLVKTPEFGEWFQRQPDAVKRLASSIKSEDAILMLVLYKRDKGLR